MVIPVFVWFFVPETKGHTLEETALLFDGFDAIRDLQADDDVFAANDKVLGVTPGGEVTFDETKAVDVEHREDVRPLQSLV